MKESVLVPATPLLPALQVLESPFRHLQSPSRSQLAETRTIPAAKRRLLQPQFISTFRWEAIRPLLPFQRPPPATHLPGRHAAAVLIIAGSLPRAIPRPNWPAWIPST